MNSTRNISSNNENRFEINLPGNTAKGKKLRYILNEDCCIRLSSRIQAVNILLYPIWIQGLPNLNNMSFVHFMEFYKDLVFCKYFPSPDILIFDLLHTCYYKTDVCSLSWSLALAVNQFLDRKYCFTNSLWSYVNIDCISLPKPLSHARYLSNTAVRSTSSERLEAE